MGGRRKVITIPAEPAEPDQLPPLLKPFKAVPPLVTDIELSIDDRFLYVSCWGTGELKQFDVSDPFNPKLTGTVRIGGIVVASRRTRPRQRPLNGGPQMVEVSRDGRRVYLTNSLYGALDAQFYPEGIQGWMVKLDADPEGGIAFDPQLLPRLAGDAAAASGPAGGRRRLDRLLLLSVTGATSRNAADVDGRRLTPLWPWLASWSGSAPFMGSIPAMGWLFAVALGLHRQSRAVVLLSLVPIALGHAIAIAVAVYLVVGLGQVIDAHALRIVTGCLLIAWGVYYLLYGHHHRVRIGLRTGYIGLGIWSFLMASAHGAGLMLIPALMPLQEHAEHMHAEHMHAMP